MKARAIARGISALNRSTMCSDAEMNFTTKITRATKKGVADTEANLS